MRRLTLNPRGNWQKIVESQGLTFHSRSGIYWNEEACYEFTDNEIDELESAANEVHERCLETAQYIIDKNLFSRMSIPQSAIPLILDSWNNDQLHLYGRFDFAYDGLNPPKLLEYNADTPTSLLEASIIQWYWLQDIYPKFDQFNSLHEKLIQRWKELSQKQEIKECYFSTSYDNEDIAPFEEDVMTTEYLRDTANQASIRTEFIRLEDIGYNKESKDFRDLNEKQIKNLFKLYPLEKMVNEEFGKYLGMTNPRLIEPAWKMLWSNKALLPILYELFPDHPNLLPAYFTKDKISESYVKKPIFGREGSNVLIHNYVKTAETNGDYNDNFIYQKYFSIPTFDGKTPVLGVWMIGDEACGMGIRESDNIITNNTSRFTPHYFKGPFNIEGLIEKHITLP